MQLYTETPLHFPLNENRDWAQSSVKRKYQTKKQTYVAKQIPNKNIKVA